MHKNNQTLSSSIRMIITLDTCYTELNLLLRQDLGIVNLALGVRFSQQVKDPYH